LKNILVLVHDDPGQEARLKVAFDLTHTLGGHLICLDLTIPFFIPPTGTFYETSTIIDRSAEAANRSRVRSRLDSDGRSFTWIDRTDTLNNAIISVADMADIIVLSAPGDMAFPDMEGAAGAALISAGTAIVVVPAAAHGIRLTGEALIAWDGSQEAADAMRAAVPLLRHARLATIVEIDDGSLDKTAAQALSYLEQRGVRATIRADLAFGEKAGVLLLEQIGLLKADYVVMGGFGHPRIVERVFGGVTHRLLHESPVPLFLKH